MGNQIELLQGTLDLLILKTLALEPCTAGGSPSASSRFHRTFYRSDRVALSRASPAGAAWLDRLRVEHL